MSSPADSTIPIVVVLDEPAVPAALNHDRHANNGLVSMIPVVMNDVLVEQEDQPPPIMVVVDASIGILIGEDHNQGGATPEQAPPTVTLMQSRACCGSCATILIFVCLIVSGRIMISWIHPSSR
jgi:hypothetical protein